MSDSVLLAPNEKVEFTSPLIRYPMLASRKMDGMRLFMRAGELLTRTYKPQPNKTLTTYLGTVVQLSAQKKWCFDGEFYKHEMPFNQQQSVMRGYHNVIPPGFKFYVFDFMTLGEFDARKSLPFERRVNNYNQIIDALGFDRVVAVEQLLVNNAGEAQALYEQWVSEGYEGLMLRSPGGTYKHNRATLSECIIYKFKEWTREDAKIIGFEQARRMKESVRLGPRTRDARGFLERTHKQDDFELIDSLGSFMVRLDDGTEVNVGLAKGYDQAARDKFWKQRDQLLGKYIEFEYQKHGTKDKPRMGRFLWFREDKD